MNSYINDCDCSEPEPFFSCICLVMALSGHIPTLCDHVFRIAV